MRAAIIILVLMFGSQAGAECGKLCDEIWWETATAADLQVELDGGADVNARTDRSITPLHWAAYYGTPGFVETLIAAGSDVSLRTDDGWTPLHAAVSSLHINLTNINALIDAGADVKARDDGGSTPLHWATHYGIHAHVEVLIAAGSDVMARDENGTTPLHDAAKCSDSCFSETIRTLLAAGADAKVKDKEGKTPWDHAQENDQLKGTKGYWALNDAQYN